ncbi:MAG: hypothetical protein ACRD1Y_06050 [Terriglobales bacterium]
MDSSTQRLAAAFFDKTGEAKEAIAALRQAGFTQIGVASHDDSQERKLAETTATQPGVAVSPNAGGELLRDGEESDFANVSDIQNTLLSAHLSAHEAKYYRERLESNGVLVTVEAPGERWTQARRTLEECGGDAATENPAASATESHEVEPDLAPPPVRTNIPNPAQQGTVVVKREPETPQSDYDVQREGRRIELRGTLARAHRERLTSPATTPVTESDAEYERQKRKIA